MPGFRLTVVGGKDVGQSIEVAGPELTPIKIGRKSPDSSRDIEAIGRPADAARDLLLAGDRQVSRVHVKIETGPRGYRLIDCQSANRTRHNGRLLTAGEPTPLRDGDELRLGPDTLVRFELLDPAAAPTRAPDPPPPSAVRPSPAEPSGRSAASQPSRPTPSPPSLAMAALAPDPSLASVDVQPAPEPPPSADEPRPNESSQGFRRARTSPPPPGEPPPRETWGKFVVFQTVSDGPAVRVHLAIDRDRNERLALKRYARSQLSSKARTSLLASAQKARSWKHASIAEVYEHGEQGDVIFVASRWIEGKSLGELQLAHGEEIEIPLALYLVRDMCAALRHGQSVERGFVWRNLNPRNLVIDRDGHAVAVNFGLPSSRLLIDGQEPTDTPEARYLSPEQRHGKETDPRSDLYSVGVILHELLGQKPIDAGQKILKDAVGLRKDIPWDVADVANKAVQYRAERRFIHAADMEEALAALLQKLYPQFGTEPAAWIAKRLTR